MNEKEMRELDAWILETLFKDEVREFDRYYIGSDLVYFKEDEPFTPTTDPAAAMQVLEKCAEKLYTLEHPESVSILGSPQDGWTVYATNSNGASWEADAPTLPLAIAKFAKELFK